MTTNTNDQKIKTNPDLDRIRAEMQKVLDETIEINKEIDIVNKESNEKVAEIEKNVDESINTLEGIYSDLDKAKQEASDKLDDIAIEESIDLASDE